MSLAELKEQAWALSPQDRLELAAFLAELEEQNEPDFQPPHSTGRFFT